MFLAINELMKEKSRFLLITLVIVLVSYLTFFLTALAYGLATSYTQGIDKWGADGVVTLKDANSNISRSRISGSQYDKINAKEKAPLGVGLSVAVLDEVKEDISIFGIERDSFIMPDLSDGRAFEKSGEVVVDSGLSDTLNIGSKLTLFGNEIEYTVVGFTENATFQTSPIVYMSLPDWREQAAQSSGMTGMRDASTISAVVVRGDDEENSLTGISTNNDLLELQSIRDFVFKLPGYQAQVLTFGTMIGFLIAIASFVLAIFMYILTLQKRSIFGVLKAEGVPNRYISRSVMAQVIILSVFGLATGLALALLSGWLLSGKVPFMVNLFFFGGIAVLFLVCAAIGAIASVRSVTKIDPVEAIG